MFWLNVLTEFRARPNKARSFDELSALDRRDDAALTPCKDNLHGSFQRPGPTGKLHRYAICGARLPIFIFVSSIS
jgi:hypothetical protein